jgi:hypothetical protein
MEYGKDGLSGEDGEDGLSGGDGEDGLPGMYVGEDGCAGLRVRRGGLASYMVTISKMIIHYYNNFTSLGDIRVMVNTVSIGSLGA